MYRTGWGALLLLVLGAALGAADDRKDKDKGKSDKPATVADQYKTLTQEYQKAQQEIEQEYSKAKGEEEQGKLMVKARKLGSTFAGRFLELAEKNPKDEAALDALVWILTNAEQTPEAAKAADLMVRDHLQNKKVAALTQRLVYSLFPSGERVVRGVAEKSKDHDAQGQAWYALAQLLKNKAGAIGQIKGLDEKTRKIVDATYGKDFLDQFAKQDPSKLQKEAEEAFARVEKDFAGVKGPRGTLGDLVKGDLFELRNLTIGKVAMDIEGEDVDGKKFKLSDYRGKVVVIDFWGNW